MERGLSEYSVKSALDAGQKVLTWKPEAPAGFFAGVDFDKILETGKARDIVQSMPVQPLFFALKRRGFDESLDILPLLSKSQVIRILDYDVWDGNRLDCKRAYSLLSNFRLISAEELYKRYSNLDEEYQIALLQGKVDLFTSEELDNLPEDLKDVLRVMPCNSVFYRFKVDTPEEDDFLESLVQAALSCNIAYAYSLLQHAFYMPPNESEYQLGQFRSARLEEDGFVSYETSLKIFSPMDITSLATKWASWRPVKRLGASSLIPKATSVNFFDIVLDQGRRDQWDIDELFLFHQQLLNLSNSLCAAAKVEPDDVYGLDRILQQCKAMVGLGLEFLSGSDLSLAGRIVKKEHLQTLFRAGISLVNEIRSDFIIKLIDAGDKGAVELLSMHRSGRWGAVIYELDTSYRDILGFEAIEILKGLFNRFPMCPVDFSGKTEKISFAPIGSMDGFRRMISFIDAISGVIYLLKLVGNNLNEASLEKALSTAFLRSLVGGFFNCDALSKKDIEAFDKLDRGDLDLALKTANKSVSEYLEKTQDQWCFGKRFNNLDSSIEMALRLLNEIMNPILVAKEHGFSVDGLVIQR